MKILHYLKSAANSLKHDLYPPAYTCDLCGRESFYGNLCPECTIKVVRNDQHTCVACGRRYVSDGVCIECKASPPLFDKGVSALVYSEGTAGLVRKFKNGGAYLADWFSDVVFEKLPDLGEFDLIVCVPMTKKAERKRGYNQAKLLARRLSEKTGARFLPELLQKTKPTGEQKSLTRKERAENLKASFKVTDKSAITHKRVLIVDDVMTTGATLDEISRVLKRAGAMKVFAATVASVEYATIKKDDIKKDSDKK